MLFRSGSFCERSRKSLIHLRRDSEGLNWNPQRTFKGWEGCDKEDSELEGENEEGEAFGSATYAISVGTLSLVMPLLPGQVLMISTSSGVEVYTTATLHSVSHLHCRPNTILENVELVSA